MNRDQVFNEIKEIFGLVPSFFKEIPDSLLESEWRLFKEIEFAGGPIPNKYRELIGIAVSAVSKCKYCALFHTEIAKLYGATDEEIQAAVHYAKNSAGWSTYINGMQMDFETFKTEVKSACEYVRSMQS